MKDEKWAGSHGISFRRSDLHGWQPAQRNGVSTPVFIRFLESKLLEHGIKEGRTRLGNGGAPCAASNSAAVARLAYSLT
jgi:hypothetical protein